MIQHHAALDFAPGNYKVLLRACHTQHQRATEPAFVIRLLKSSKPDFLVI